MNPRTPSIDDREPAALFSSRDSPAESPSPRGTTHVPSPHRPLWDALPEKFADPFARSKGHRPLFFRPGPVESLESLTQKSGVFVFVGATGSGPLETALSLQGRTVLLAEPDRDRLRSWMESRRSSNATMPGLCLGGGVGGFDFPLDSLAEHLTEDGCPLFLIQKGMETSHPTYLQRLIQSLEVLYYRKRIFPVESQANSRGLPLRPLKRGLFLDQVRHLYENAPLLARLPGIDLLDGLFRGSPAWLAGAGPDLARMAPLMARDKGRIPIVCIDRALKPLLAAGVEPDLVVIRDTSLTAKRSFSGLDRLENTLLACHALSHCRPEGFGAVLFYGGPESGAPDTPAGGLPEGDPPRLELPDLPGHGSVISNGLSLLRRMGCAKVLLAGVQFASEEPTSMAYAAEAAHGEHQPSGGSVALYPVADARGRTMYATPNYLDSVHWILEHLAMDPVEVVNTTSRTILHGRGVLVDDSLAERPLADAEGTDVEQGVRGVLEQMAACRGWTPGLEAHAAREMLERARAWWEPRVRECEAVSALKGSPGFLPAGEDLTGRFDADQTSYLVQRWPGFSNPHFHECFFDSTDPAARTRGLTHYLHHVRAMAEELLRVAGTALGRLPE